MAAKPAGSDGGTGTEGDGKSASGATMGDLRALVTEVVSSIVPEVMKGSGTAKTETAKVETPAASAPQDIAEQVRQQVQRIKEQEERTRKEQETDSTIKALLEKTAEKPPVERRRVHKIMGWGD